MKNFVKSSFLILAASVLFIACKGSGSSDGSDTAKADSMVQTTSDTTVKIDTVKKDTLTADTTAIRKDTISKKTTVKTVVKKSVTKN